MKLFIILKLNEKTFEDEFKANQVLTKFIPYFFKKRV